MIYLAVVIFHFQMIFMQLKKLKHKMTRSWIKATGSQNQNRQIGALCTKNRQIYFANIQKIFAYMVGCLKRGLTFMVSKGLPKGLNLHKKVCKTFGYNFILKLKMMTLINV